MQISYVIGHYIWASSSIWPSRKNFQSDWLLQKSKFRQFRYSFFDKEMVQISEVKGTFNLPFSAQEHFLYTRHRARKPGCCSFTHQRFGSSRRWRSRANSGRIHRPTASSWSASYMYPINMVGLRYSRWFDQGKEDGRSGNVVGGGFWNRENSTCTCNCPGTWSTSSVLSHRRKWGVQLRDQKDRGPYGELSACHWYLFFGICINQ